MLSILCSLLMLNTAQANPAKAVSVALMDSTGKQIGTATIKAAKKGVEIHLKAEGMSPGEHAIHFHEKAVCTGPDFKSAGGHFASSGEEHGFDNPKGPHDGDMRNFTVGKDGKVDAKVANERVTLSKLEAAGSALVIHAKPDDYKSQPAGAAGDRVVCGEIHGG